jgi:O-antigen/teichoic acid export membrane protein
MIQFSEDKKRLFSNFFSLSALQAVNMVLPLITLPYLVRVLGVENFGLINFSLSIIMYFNILVSFGFELSATREISIHRGNNKKIAEIYSSVMMIKTIFLILSFLILSFLILSIDSLKEHAILYFTTFGIVIGNVLFPSWFFQGMERMKHITYITVTSRIIFTILIFVLVRDSTDYIYVPLLNSLASIIGGIYAIYLVFNLFSVKLLIPNKYMIIIQLKNSFHFFLSRIANNGSRYYATTLIGLYFGNVLVGYYAMVEKLFYAFMSLGSIVSQTIYPYMSRTKNVAFFKKILFSVIGISIVLLIPLIIFNEAFLNLVYNINNELLSNIFLIIFSGAIFGIISALIGYPFLAAFGFINYANNSLIYASIIYMLYITAIVMLFKNILLVASALVIYNLLGMLFRLYYIRKEKLFNNPNWKQK